MLEGPLSFFSSFESIDSFYVAYNTMYYLVVCRHVDNLCMYPRCLFFGILLNLKLSYFFVRPTSQKLDWRNTSLDSATVNIQSTLWVPNSVFLYIYRKFTSYFLFISVITHGPPLKCKRGIWSFWHPIAYAFDF